MPTEHTVDTEVHPGRGRIVVIVIASVLTVLAALGVWYWSKRGNEPAPAEASSPVKSTLHLETFVLNLADPGERAYMRVGVDLGLGREIGRGEDAPPVAQIRDTILGVLAQSRGEDLLTEKGKSKLKGDLLHALQERVPGQKVEEVYFTELLIQR